MKYIIIIFVIVISVIPLSAQQQKAPEVSTIKPVPSNLNKAASAGWSNGSTWLQQHKDINQIGKDRKVDLVFLGNSITQSWGGEGRNIWKPAQSVWDKYYSNRNAANFGISGDRTQHILWRIENGNFDDIQPKVIVLMAGTNNLKENTTNEIVLGIEAVLEKLHQKAPDAKVLLLGIFPRGEKPDDPLREKTNKINRIISKFNDNKKVFFMNIGHVFLNDDGTCNLSLMCSDFIHVEIQGYIAWAEAIEPTLIQLIK